MQVHFKTKFKKTLLVFEIVLLYPFLPGISPVNFDVTDGSDRQQKGCPPSKQLLSSNF